MVKKDDGWREEEEGGAEDLICLGGNSELAKEPRQRATNRQSSNRNKLRRVGRGRTRSFGHIRLQAPPIIVSSLPGTLDSAVELLSPIHDPHASHTAY